MCYLNIHIYSGILKNNGEKKFLLRASEEKIYMKHLTYMFHIFHLYETLDSSTLEL